MLKQRIVFLLFHELLDHLSLYLRFRQVRLSLQGLLDFLGEHGLRNLHLLGRHNLLLLLYFGHDLVLVRLLLSQLGLELFNLGLEGANLLINLHYGPLIQFDGRSLLPVDLLGFFSHLGKLAELRGLLE